jgi:uncharacterized membrane protein YphA (DoxX/SURF4 family)
VSTQRQGRPPKRSQTQPGRPAGKRAQQAAHQTVQRAAHQTAQQADQQADQQAAASPLSAPERAAQAVSEWGPTVCRLLLGLVLAWFGYHELVQPALWTGYVPVVSATSTIAILAVLAHGWLLLVLAAALIVGVASRAASAVAALLLLEIVISLTVTGGLSDLTMRDIGVLGLAVLLASGTRQRLALTT